MNYRPNYRRARALALEIEAARAARAAVAASRAAEREAQRSIFLNIFCPEDGQ